MSTMRDVFEVTINHVYQNPYLLIVYFILLVIFPTFISSQLEFRSAVSSLKKGAGPPPTLPYKIPFFGHAISFARGLNQFLSSQSRTNPQLGVFTLHLGGTRHNMVVAPSVAHQILTARNIPVHMRELVLRTVETVWGDRKQTIRATPPTFLWGDAHRILSNMMRETFVTSSLSATVTRVSTDILNLVSSTSSVIDRSSWERTANITPVSGPRPNTVEADLYPLLRDFIGTIATTVLMGSDFLTNYPSTLSDLWLLDSQFNLFMTGLPDWIPALRQPSRARNRIVEAVRQHHLAYVKYANGEDPGSLWGNIEDTSTVMADRALSWQRVDTTQQQESSSGGKLTTNPNDGMLGGIGDASMIWAMNVNSNQIVFWMVFYIFSTPDLLSQIRDEIAPHITVSQIQTTSNQEAGGIDVQPDIKIDLEALSRDCPLLQGVFLETMRLEAQSMSYKYVEEDFSVRESEEDARVFGHEESRLWTYLFRKGEYVCIPHGVHQSDGRYFEHPDRFEPRRFWVGGGGCAEGEGENGKGDVVVDADGNIVASPTVPAAAPGDETKHNKPQISYRTMKPWGGGKEVCKGRKFAEGEVVLFAAAVVYFWDMVPVPVPVPVETGRAKGMWMGLGLGFFGNGNGSGGGDGEGGTKGDGERKGSKEGKWVHPGRKAAAGSAKPLRNVRVRMTRRDLGALVA